MLVAGAMPEFDVVGYIGGEQAKSDDDWIKSPGDNGPAYFVPRRALTLLSDAD